MEQPKTNQGQTINFKFVSFQDLLQASAKLALKIQAEHQAEPFDLVISINRGGAVASRILSDLLDLSMGAFAMSSYIGVRNQKKLEITQPLNLSIEKQKVLLVDEICDTGQTFKVARDHVAGLEPREIKTATLYQKKTADFRPDHWVELVDKWIVFPYEIRETLAGLKQDQTARGEVINFFTQLGLSEEVLTKFDN